MPDNQPQDTNNSLETDLSSEVTVFVTTVGAPGFDACLQHLNRQDANFRTQIIDHVAPMSAAFQKMLDDCATPYYVQVDEDMLLKPITIRWLYERMIEAEPDVAIVVGYLFDTHLGFPVQGVKMFRHDIVRKFPFATVEACELDHNQRLKSGGYKLKIFKPEDVADTEDGTLGLHGTHWTPKTIYERYATLERKYRRFPERLRPVGEWPGSILKRFLDEGLEIDLFALMGVMAGRLELLEDEGQEKDYRTYDDMRGFEQAKDFVETLVSESAGRQKKMAEKIFQPSQIAAKPAVYNVGHKGAVLQQPFDVAVVMPTLLRPTIGRALQSVFEQHFEGRIQILIGVDTSQADRHILTEICQGQPANVVVTILDLGYSTSVLHGGLHPAMGGVLRTSLSYLANSRYVAYLDDDNWWRDDHLSTLLRAVDGVDYAYSLRWYVDGRSGKPICVDQWESVGVDAGIYAEKNGGFVDTNCLMIDKLRCESVLRFWSVPAKDSVMGRGADHSVFHVLQKGFKHGSTGLPTAFYVMNPNDALNSQRKAWMREARPPESAVRPMRTSPQSTRNRDVQTAN